MTVEEARASVGLPVMSRDAGRKLIRSVDEPHGPYMLLHVTKGGEAIIARWQDADLKVPPSLLSKYEPPTLPPVEPLKKLCHEPD